MSTLGANGIKPRRFGFFDPFASLEYPAIELWDVPVVPPVVTPVSIASDEAFGTPTVARAGGGPYSPGSAAFLGIPIS